MKKLFTVVAVILFASQMVMAENVWPLSITVLLTQEVNSRHGSFYTPSSPAGLFRRSVKHIFVDAEDGNTYDLVPSKSDDTLVPNVYQSILEPSDLKVCVLNGKDRCKGVKFHIANSAPTIQVQ